MEYKKENGKLYVKEQGQWIPLVSHIRSEHPEAYHKLKNEGRVE